MPKFRFLDEIVSLSRQAVTVRKDHTLPYVGLEHLESGRSVLSATAMASDSVSTNFVFEPGDILFGKLRPSLKKSIRVDRRGYCSTDLLVLRAKRTVDPSFAGWVMRSKQVFAEAVRTAEGTKMPRTSWSRLRSLKVFAPAELEQRRIAEILDALDAQIEYSRLLVDKTALLRTGLLDRVFHDMPLIESLGQLLLSTPKNGIYKPSTDYDDAGIPILRIDSFHAGQIRPLDSLLRVQLDAGEIMQFSVSVDDIIINRVNSIDYVGKSAIVPHYKEPVVYESNMMRCRINREVALAKFVALWLGTAAAMRHFRSCAKSAIAQASINQRDVRSCPTPAAPIEKQAEVVHLISEVDEQLKTRRQELHQFRLLKQGLMEDLLTGRVRVSEAEAVLESL